MKSSNIIVSVLSVLMLMAIMPGAYTVGSAQIKAPAVILSNNTGSLTSISVVITNGSGIVSFTNSTLVANSTVDSARTAAGYASYYLGKNESHYNFVYTINDDGSNVSGPSAGAAMTLLAIAAFENKPINSGFTITGTINSDGTIGQIGGVIDKASAAAGAKLSFLLVPFAAPGTLEEGIYYIAQQKYGIPLIEVANISHAVKYALGNASIVGQRVSLNLSDNYHIGSVSQSQLQCSNNCNAAPFADFANYTLNLTNAQISDLSQNQGFATAGEQLSNVLEQAAVLHSKGYNYISADIAFLDYINAFYLSSYNVSRGSALGYMQEIQNSCQSLIPPTVTNTNYEYIIGAQLREGWANYTINSTISSFNATGATDDDIIYAMQSAGQANAWCGAASYLYNYNYGNGTPIRFSDTLAQITYSRINRASQDPGMYLTLANATYKRGNYPVAIIDADYAYALSDFSVPQGVGGTTQLVNESLAIANKSTYGVWATEFAKESQFYAYQSGAATNVSFGKLYAEQAYSSATLANVISADTKIINQSIIVVPFNSSSVQNTNSQEPNDIRAVAMIGALQTQVSDLTAIVGISLVVLMGCISMLFVLGHKLLKLTVRLDPKRNKKKAR